MPEFYPGQHFRIKSADEIAAEYGYSLGDFDDDDIRIGDIVISSEMTDFFGKTYIAEDVDKGDSAVYLVGCNFWWPFDLLEMVDEPGVFFGFRVGDQVEFIDYSEARRVPWFTAEMKYLCGTTGIITNIIPVSHSLAQIVVERNDAYGLDWNLNTLMVRHVESVPDIQLDGWLTVAFQ